jgi:hypothetical protein
MSRGCLPRLLRTGAGRRAPAGKPIAEGGRTKVRRLLRRAIICAVAVGFAPAHATADTIARGAVVEASAGEIYINLGARAGVEDGARLRIKRPIKLRHPITRKWVQDWLPVGAAEVTQAGQQLSMAVLAPELLAEVAVGDIVEVYVERDDDPPPPTPKKPAKPDPDPRPVDDRPLPQIDADTQAVLTVWASTKGAGLEVRIGAWEGYLATHADSPHAGAIEADLALLRELRDVLAPPTATSRTSVHRLDHHAPTQAVAGEAVPLVFVIAGPACAADAVGPTCPPLTAWLHYRAIGAPTYQRLRLAREDDLYLRGELPPAAVAAPGVEYFVEVIDASGAAGVAVSPHAIEIDAPGVAARFEPARRRTRVSVSATWMDFATFDRRDDTDHTDRFYQLETDVTYRIDGRLAAMSAGLGMIQGEGGLADPAPGVAIRHAGFQYGYAEAELQLAHRLGAAARLIAGVDSDGLGFGGAARLRIGEPEATHLALTASRIAGIGALTEVRFQVDPFGQAPVGLSVGVTDQPAQGDLAVRLGVDVGLRTLPWLEPVVRVSYQGRTVEHSGLGAGLGLNFHW